MSGESPPAGDHSAPDTPRVAGYTLVKRIGRGRYGEVWLARGIAGKWCAVKIVFRDRFDEERSFHREFDGLREYEGLTAAHPGLLRVLHADRAEDDTYYYYVMELADGLARPDPDPNAYQPRTLASRLAQSGRLPPAECAAIGADVAAALSHLHRNGKVHRDIKPANIIFVEGRPKLADIGLVSNASRCESFVGTEGYVPREGPGSPSADLFALGKVLYEAATGRDRLDFPELPEDFRGSADRAFQRLNVVLARACHPDAARRYATAGEMESDLRAVAAAGALPSRKHRGYRRMVAGATVIMAVAAIAPALRAWRLRSGETQAARPLVIGANASRDGWFTDGGDITNTRRYPRAAARTTPRPLFQECWSVPGENALAGDVNGDGRVEVVILRGRTLSAVDARGRTLWTVPVPPNAQFDLLHDVNGDNAPDAAVGWVEGNTASVRFFDGLGREIRTLSTTFPHTAYQISAHAAADFANDGRLGVLCSLWAGYTLYPRGLLLFDYETGAVRWFHPVAPFVKDIAIDDLDRDGRLDIVFGTYAVGNGAQVGAETDFDCRVTALRHDGNRMWSVRVGATFQGSAVAVTDLNRDTSRRAAVGIWSSWPARRDDRSAMRTLGADGTPTAYRGLRHTIAGERLVLGNWDERSEGLEIAFGNRDGRVYIFDADLNEVRSTAVGAEPVAQAMADLTGDGRLELIVTTRDGRLLLLDTELRTLAEHRFAAREVPPRIRIADITGNGIPDLILVTDRVALIAVEPAK